MLVLFLGSLLIHLPGTWSLPLIDRDEPRFAEAAREMLQNGDYVVPYFNGNYRFDKPPLIYWCQIACYRIFGVNEFAARFPSVLAAALTAMAVAALGERMFGRATGFWAGAIFATCLQTIIHAKASVADMVMILFYVTASWSAWEMSRSRERIWWWVFYLSLGLGFLAKGPVAWIPIAVILTWAVVSKTKLKGYLWPVGLFLALAIVAAWGNPALAATNGEFFKIGIGKHVVGRSLVAMEGHGASVWWVYLLMLPLFFVLVFPFFLPWSLYLPGLVRNAWKRRRSLAPDELFLWISVLWIFGVFTLVRTKLPHYILPAYPFLALLIARYTLQTAPNWLPKLTLGTVGVALAAGFVACPLLEGMFPSRSVFKVTQSELKPETQVASADFGEPSVVWEFRKKVKSFIQFADVDDVDEFMREPGSRITILPTERLPRSFPSPDPAWKMARVQGINLVKGKRVDLTVVIKEGE